VGQRRGDTWVCVIGPVESIEVRDGAAEVFQDLQVARVDECCSGGEGEGDKETEGIMREGGGMAVRM
jgi:hypothetical protein